MKNIMICLEKMDIGGIETSVLNQALEYKRRGIKPIIIASKGIYVDILKENNIDFEEIEFTLENNIDMEKAQKIMNLIDKYNVEQVVINQLPCILSVLPACIIKNIPYVAYVHTSLKVIQDDDINMYNWYEKTFPIYKDLLNVYFQNAYKIIAISKIAGDYVIDRYQVSKNKLQVFFNSIDLNLYKSTEKENKKEKWVVISRLSNEKEQSIKNAIDIFNYYDNANKTLTIVGDGKKKEELEEYVREKESKDKITFVGARNDVKDIIDENDVVLGVDRVILEALAMKKIAVLIGYDKPKQIITKNNIEIEANEGFCGASLESSSIQELASKIKITNIDTEENYQYVKENLTIQKNIYLVEPEMQKYENANSEIWKLIVKMQIEKITLEGRLNKKQNQEKEQEHSKNKQIEEQQKKLEQMQLELERIKIENDKNFQELQSLYNSKRFKIVNKIANIVKPNKNF